MVVVGLAVETACGSSISQNCQKSCGSFQPANYCLDYCHSALLARVHCYNIVRSWRKLEIVSFMEELRPFLILASARLEELRDFETFSTFLVFYFNDTAPSRIKLTVQCTAVTDIPLKGIL